MYAIRYHVPQHPTLGGSTYTIQEVQELEGLNLDCVRTLELLTKPTRRDIGAPLLDAPCRAQLLQQGRYWAQHILEGPTSWILLISD